LPPEGFKDFPIHVDLHTRKEQDAKQGWQNLFKEFDKALGFKTCGIMIHHMRMNSQAFILLEFLLKLFSEYEQIKIITYKNLI
ncbi:MAG: polysaccharide deacetylase, partial [Desulfobacula sp.]|nr:polysaccharide deacetylase [Desulfobacula sp.]